MELSTEYRSRPLHLSNSARADQLGQQQSNQPIQLSPNTLLSFQNPQDIDHVAVHRVPPESVYSPGYTDGQAIFDLYNNFPTATTFDPEHHPPRAGPSGTGSNPNAMARQPSIKVIRPQEEDENEDAYGGTEGAAMDTVSDLVEDRGSWNSAHSGKQAVAGQPRESTASAMTMESEMAPFAFSRYTSGPLQRKQSARHAKQSSGDTSHPNSRSSNGPALTPPPSGPPPRTSSAQHSVPPTPRSSPPAPLPSTFYTPESNVYTPPQSHDATFASTSSSPSTPRANLAPAPAVPPAGVLSGRAKSQSPIKNFSRPNFSRPIVREREDSNGSSAGGHGLAPAAMVRSDSTGSIEGRLGQAAGSSVGHGSGTSASLNRSDSNGHGYAESSAGHGSSVQSHGEAASLSASWEDRQQWGRPSFEHQASHCGHGQGVGSVSSSRQETLRPDGTIYSPQLDDTYGPLYPTGGGARSSDSPPGSTSPALVPPPSLGRSEAGGSGTPPGSPRHRNVLRKPRPAEPPLSPPKEKEGGWFKSRAKSRSPQPPPQAESQPPSSEGPYSQYDRSAVHPRASVGTTFTNASGVTSASFVPHTQREWGLAPQEARRRAQERHAHEQMSLQPGAGKRTAAGFVHRGEAGLAPEWLAVEQIEEEDEVESLHALGLSLPGTPGVGGGGQSGRSGQAGKAGDAQSLYSNYSYYTLPESSLNSPVPSPNQDSSPALQQKALARQSTTLEKTKAGLVGGVPRVALTPAEAQSPEDFLQLGIEFHECGELERSAWCFEQSTKRDGGCGAGFLMYGLALRHGWGCQMQPELGFSHLQRAAESVVGELSRFSPGALPDLSARSAARTAVVLALYEMGTSFRFGWGTPKDKRMAVEYFTMAAELGDPDAQSDLAFCWANGKGCKKDMRKAARYYRMAVAQGGESFGLSWIYKPKYMDT